jgi:hypothetical protein
MRYVLLLPTLSLLLAGCAFTASTHRINPSHPSIDLKTDGIYIISAPPEEVEIGALDHFRDDFGTREGDREQESLATYFDRHFLAELKSSVHPPNFIPVKMERTVESGFPFRIYLDSAGPKQLHLRFWVPHRDALVAKGIQARYTLSVAALEFRMSSNRGRSGGAVSSGTSRHAMGPSGDPIPKIIPHGDGEALTFSFIYLIWDYHANDFVACGTAEGSSSAAFAYTRDNWESILQQATQKVIGRTPLKHYRRSVPRPVGLWN